MQHTPNASVAARTGANCGTRSSGGGPRLALYLIVEAVAERVAGGIEDDGDVIGVGLLQQFRQHVRKARTAAIGVPSERVNGGSA